MWSTFSRRGFLAAGATIAGGALLGTAGCTDDPLAPTDPAGGPSLAKTSDGDLADPPTLALPASLTISTKSVTVAGRTVDRTCTYGDSFPAPTISVRQGEWVDLTFVNRILLTESDATVPAYGRRRPGSQTNVHFHGTHVTPMGSGDNMTVMLDKGDSFRYNFRVPTDHPAGLFWYHPHLHGLVTSQMSRGAAGMLYITNAHTRAVNRLYRRRILVLQQLYLDADLRTAISDDGERDDPLRAITVINGEESPLIRMRPGERQVWSISNASSSAFYQLHFPDTVGVRVLAYDGLTRAGFADPTDAGPVVQIAPGKRVEIEVKVSGQPGAWPLVLDAYFQGVDTWPARTIATVVVSGAPMSDAGPVPLDPAGLPNLMGVAPDKSRTIIFDQNDAVPEGEFGRFRMYLEGSTPHAWDPNVPEWTDSVLGQVEQWTLKNLTEQEHPIHVHVNPFQVISVSGVYNGGTPAPVLVTGHHDTVVVPPFGSAVVKTRFTEFPGGPILMHCHILDHEDMGMMTSFYIQPA